MSENRDLKRLVELYSELRERDATEQRAAKDAFEAEVDRVTREKKADPDKIRAAVKHKYFLECKSEAQRSGRRPPGLSRPAPPPGTGR